MGRRAGNPTVIPTPRDRVISAEDDAMMQSFLDRGPVAFEIYYSDGSMVAGTTIGDWQSAPNTDVQVVVVSFADSGYAKVYGLDTYGIGGFAKTGTWMDDQAYFDLLDSIHSRSGLV